MDIDFYISSLLYKLKKGENTIEQTCALFPEKNREKVQELLENISFPINLDYLRELTSLFNE